MAQRTVNFDRAAALAGPVVTRISIALLEIIELGVRNVLEDRAEEEESGREETGESEPILGVCWMGHKNILWPKTFVPGTTAIARGRCLTAAEQALGRSCGEVPIGESVIVEQRLRKVKADGDS